MSPIFNYSVDMGLLSSKLSTNILFGRRARLAGPRTSVAWRAPSFSGARARIGWATVASRRYRRTESSSWRPATGGRPDRVA